MLERNKTVVERQYNKAIDILKEHYDTILLLIWCLFFICYELYWVIFTDVFFVLHFVCLCIQLYCGFKTAALCVYLDVHTAIKTIVKHWFMTVKVKYDN